MKSVKSADESTQSARYAMRGQDDGNLRLPEEILAAASLAVILSWYYVVVLGTIVLTALAFLPGWRPYALTLLVLEWGDLLIPLDHQIWPAFCNSWMFTLWRRYFYYEWVLEERLDPAKRYLFAEMPHGVFPWGEFLSISKTAEIFPGRKINSIAASVVFRMPLLRHIFSYIGCRPASPANIKAIFGEGAWVAITVGGMAEIFLINSDKERVYLRKHKGFVREAMKNGADLVPVFCFGNSKLLSVLGENSRLSMGLLKKISRRLQASILIMYGRFWLPIPLRLPLKFVIGKPIKVKPTAKPSPEEIQSLHDHFCNQLAELYYRHRPAWETRDLLIL